MVVRSDMCSTETGLPPSSDFLLWYMVGASMHRADGMRSGTGVRSFCLKNGLGVGDKHTAFSISGMEPCGGGHRCTGPGYGYTAGNGMGIGNGAYFSYNIGGVLNALRGNYVLF